MDYYSDITLKANERIFIYSVPVGGTYTVTEQDILEGIEIAANFIAAIETLTNH